LIRRGSAAPYALSLHVHDYHEVDADLQIETGAELRQNLRPESILDLR